MTTFTRRDFLKIGAAGTATAILAGCAQENERWVKLEPYVRAPEEQLAGIPNWYATTCRMCPAGCGIIVRIMNGRAVKIEGNPEHPVNRGKVCARGQAGLQLLYNPDRVTGAVQQEERGSLKYKPLAWNDAINTLYEKLDGAGDALAVWTGSTTSGHLLDLFTRFTQAVGASDPLRYDLYSGLNGYDVLAAASENLSAEARVPVYDLGSADAVFSFGADFLGTWLSSTGYGVEFGRFRSQPYGKRGYLAQFEPKMSITGAKADRWVPVQPGMEALVAAALVRIIADQELGSADRVERAKALAGDVDLEAAAAACELKVDDLVTLARLFASAEHPLAIPGSSLTGQPDAVNATLAIQALNVVAGTAGQPGGMNVTPDLPISDIKAAAPSTFADALALIDRMKAGEIKLLLIHGANPAYDLPDAAGFVDAIANVDTVISFNTLVDETSVYADYILPDRAYLEGWGFEVAQPGFQGLPVVSGQQPVVGPLYDVRPTGDVLLTAARGIAAAAQALPWTDEVAFIKEQVTKLPKGANGGDDSDVQWARFQQHGGWWPAEQSAPSLALTLPGPVKVTPATYQGEDADYPYYLHLYLSVLLSDGSGAGLPWLQGAHDPMTTIAWQTWVEINPQTATDLDVKNGDIVKITSPNGEMEAPVYVFPGIRPDTVAIPIGQGHTALGRYAKDRGAHALALLGAATDDGGSSLVWSNVRVSIAKTGNDMALALLESTVDQAKDASIPF